LEQQLDPLLLLDDSLFIEPQSHEKHLVPPWNHWLSLQSGVYEIAGAAGSGKTQLALSLCIRAAATTSTIETTSKTTTVVSDQPTNSSIRSIYIALHKTQMISRIAQRLQQQIPSSSSSSILQRIWIKPCANTEDLCELLQDELPTILQMQHPHVRVIILDGIADLFRGGSDTTEDPNHIVTRSAELFRIGRLLQNLIRIRTQNQRKHRNHHPSSSTTISNTPLSVVVLNQVSAIFSESAVALSCHHRPTESSLSSSDPWKPALGLSWSHCIHQRFRIHRTAIQSESLNNATATTTTTHSDDASSRRRTLTLAHSSQYATPQSIDFIITTQNGCQAIRS
jgi:RecA/RadA recombinase